MPFGGSRILLYTVHKTSLYIQGRISFEYVKWGSALRGEGEWHSALSAMLRVGVIAPLYQRVKEGATGVSATGGPCLLSCKEQTATPKRHSV